MWAFVDLRSSNYNNNNSNISPHEREKKEIIFCIKNFKSL